MNNSGKQQKDAERNANSLRQLQRTISTLNHRVFVKTERVATNGARIVEVYAPITLRGADDSVYMSIAYLTAHVANVTGRKRTEGGTGAMIVDGGGMAAHDEIGLDLSRVLGFEVIAETL